MIWPPNKEVNITAFTNWIFSSLGRIFRKFGLRSPNLKYGSSTAQCSGVVLRISLQTVWSRNCVSFLCLVYSLSQNLFEISQFVVSDPYWKTTEKHFINSWRTGIVSDAAVKGDMHLWGWDTCDSSLAALWQPLLCAVTQHCDLQQYGQRKKSFSFPFFFFFSIFSNFHNVDEYITGFESGKSTSDWRISFIFLKYGKPHVSYLCFVPRIIFRLKHSILLFFTCIYFNDHIYMILQQVGLFIHREKDVRSVSCSRS